VKTTKFLKSLLLPLIVISPFTINAYADTSVDQKVADISAKAPTLNQNVLKLALTAYNCAALKGVPKQNKLTIIDYSLPSKEKRMWVIDLNSDKVLYNSLVAHGQGSGNAVATSFSDQPETHKTSLGLFVTQNTYEGKNGLSLRLNGLEKGFNASALSRAVVVHGASYVSEDMAKSQGRVGRSWGCPAVPQNLAKPIINTIKDGSMVFAYYPNQTWLSQSKYLHCDMPSVASA
jgi:L,D-transpeptidase catalytic domain